MKTACSRLTFLAVVGMVGVASMILQAATGPSWWVTRGTINTNAVPNDFAAVNQGQLKWMASQACEELETTLPGGAGYNVWSLIYSFSNTNNFRPVNLGQLKYVAQPFYDRLIEIGYTTNYPWTGSTNAANDFALANIGQMKNVFSFDVAQWLGQDSDSDGMTNGWELAHGLNPHTNDASWVSTDPWAHGLSNWQVYQNPSVLFSNNYSSLQDGVPDWWKLTYGFAITNAATMTGTNGLTLAQNYLYGRSPLVAELDVIVNGNSEWTTNRAAVEVLPLTREYPWLLVSDNALMINATMLSIWTTNAWSCTIPGTNDCRTTLYFQFANVLTNAVGPRLPRFLGVDTISPVVQITAPTTNATGVGDQLFVHLQATVYDPQPQNPSIPDSSRPLKIWVNGERYWDRQGTLIDISRFPVAPNTNTVIAIVAMDSAGNVAQATLDWFVSPNTNAAPPAMANINLEGVSLLPDLPEIWVQGKVDSSNAVVSATVNSSSAITMNMRGTTFGYLVPLEFGSNTVVLTALNAAGNASSNVYTLFRSDRYRAAVTSPLFGSYATGGPQTVSGYVSATKDEATVVSVSVVGNPVEQLGETDENGNRSFSCDLDSLIQCEDDIFSLFLTIHWSDNMETVVPIALVEGYFVREKKQKVVSNSGELGREEGAPWSVMSYLEREDSTYEFKNPCVVTTNNATYGYRYYSDSFVGDDWFAETTFLYSKWTDWLAETVGDTNGWEVTELQPGLSLNFNEQESKTTLVQWLTVDGTNCVVPYAWVDRPQEAEGSITCRAPMHYAPDTTVLFTFENVEASIPLSNLTYRGQTAVVETNATGGTNVSFMVSMPGGSEFTINKDSFGWPDAFKDNATSTNWTEVYSPEPDPWVAQYHASTSARWLRFTGFHNEDPPLRVKVTNGAARPKPWVRYDTGEAWVGISMFPTPTFTNKNAFVVIRVEHEWKNLTNAAGQVFLTDHESSYEKIYYLRRFTTDGDAKITGLTNETRVHEDDSRGLYFALVDSCTNRPAGFTQMPYLEVCITNCTGNLEITFSYTVYEGKPEYEPTFESSLGFEGSYDWLNSWKGITECESYAANANEASHGWFSDNKIVEDRLEKHKVLSGPKTHKLLLKWNSRPGQESQELIRTPYIENGPNRWGR